MTALIRFSCPSDLRDQQLNVHKEGERRNKSVLRGNGMATVDCMNPAGQWNYFCNKSWMLQ